MVLKRTLPSRVQSATPAASAAPTAPVSTPSSTPDPVETQTSAPVAAAPAAPVVSSPEPTPAPVAEQAPVEAAPLAEASGEAEITLSRPEGTGGMRRKVRDKKPRVFESPAQEEAETPAVVAPVNPIVPQTDVDFDKVGEKLSSLGVKEAARDTLTEKAAPASAVSEAPFESAPMPVAPAPEPVAAKETPAWLVELQKELAAAEQPKDKDPRRASLNLPPPPTLPPNLLAGLVEDESTPVSASPEPAAPPSAPTPVAESLPPSGMSLATKASTGPATSQSDLPWTNLAPKDDWQLDIGASPSGANAEGASLPPSAVQPGDIYGGIGAQPAGAGTPPWQPAAGSVPPAELPGPRHTFRGMGAPASGGFQLIATAAVFALVGGAVWFMLSKPDTANERLARWSGSLRETTETLPNGENGPVPERTVRMDELAQNDGLLPPPDPNAPSIQALPSTAGSGAVIDFADVAPNQARGPITSDGSEQMPEDIGFIASLQKAIAEKKAERGGDATTPATGTPAAAATGTATGSETAMDKTIKNEALKAQLDAELAAYRKALVDASNVAEAPRPAEFMAHAQQQAAAVAATPSPYIGANTGQQTTTLQPPPTAAAQAAGLPPAELYGSNPNNLPVLPEPVAEQPKVRQLSDFDVAMFEPEKEKVRIPKGIRPRMSSSDFPEMDVLSLVPNKGLIAYHNGQEGVLLIGETVDGWQLVGVNGQSAEFRGNGGKTYYVSAEQ